MRWVAPGITLLTPALYIIGFLYDQGFLSAFNIGAAMNLRSPQEYFIFAFFTLFIWCAESLKAVGKYGLWLLPAICLIALAGYWLNIQVDRLAAKQGNSIKTKIVKEELITQVNFVQKLQILTLGITLITVLLLVIAWSSYANGKNQGNTQLDAFKGCNIASQQTANCTVLRDGERIIAEGMLVSRSTSQIALFSLGKTTLLPIKDYTLDTYPPQP